MFLQQLVYLVERRGALFTLEHSLDTLDIRDDVLAAKLNFLATAARALCIKIRRHRLRLSAVISVTVLTRYRIKTAAFVRLTGKCAIPASVEGVLLRADAREGLGRSERLVGDETQRTGKASGGL